MFDTPKKENEDVELDLIDIDKVKIGEPIVAEVMMRNKAFKPRSVNITVTFTSTFYNGIRGKKIKVFKQLVPLGL